MITIAMELMAVATQLRGVVSGAIVIIITR